MLVHVSLPRQLKGADCVRQHPGVIQWLTNAVAMAAPDGDTDAHAEFPAPLSAHLAACDVAMGGLSWTLARFDGGPCHVWFTCCFDPCCRSPVSSHTDTAGLGGANRGTQGVEGRGSLPAHFIHSAYLTSTAEN